jgi:nucleotide-binding universal stress UspA family protein
VITLYKKILVPAEGTAGSDEFIRFVCSLQKLENAEIHIVYVVEVPRSLPLSECPSEKLDEAHQIIKNVENIALECGAKIQTQIIYARTTEDSILATAEQLRCDVIAISQNNPKMKLFTNVPLNIYQRAKCSVWLINMR